MIFTIGQSFQSLSTLVLRDMAGTLQVIECEDVLELSLIIND
jgi:hypothetical protein